MQNIRLTVMEELMLLSLHDKKGSQLAGPAIGLGLAGAALLDLSMMGRIRLDEAGSILTQSRTRTNSALLDEILDLLHESGKPRKAKYWVRIIPKKTKPLHHRVAEGLVVKGILAEEEARVLWVFPVRRFPERSSAPEKEIHRRIRGAIKGSRRLDEKTAGLIALMGACKLTKQVFESGERRDANRRVKEIVKSDRYGKVVAQIVKETEAAVAAAVAAGAGG